MVIKHARVRIVCAAPKMPPGAPLHVLPAASDLHVLVTSPNGDEFTLPGLLGLTLHIDADSREPVEATIRLMPDELDIEATARIASLPDDESDDEP